MGEYEFFYRLNVGYFELLSENIMKIISKELKTYEILKKPLNELKLSLYNKTKDDSDISVCVFPSIDNINQIYIKHKIEFKFLSKVPKLNTISITLMREENNKTALYYHYTTNFQEIDDLLYYFIEKQMPPDYSNWIRIAF